MAYTLKYYKTLSQPDGSNILLEIYEKDGTGASKEIGPVIQILRMDIQGSQNDIDTPIVKTSLTMTFVDAPDHEESSSKKCGNWEEFYTPDSTYWKVVLKSDSSSGSFRQIWGGYVTPDSFSEQLRYRGSVTIIARDNIGHLQDFPFDAEGNEDGMITVYDLVNAAWAKIGSPMSLDWRGEEDNALWLQCNGTDAPSAYMNVSAFEGKNWYEAVEDVLYSMGMVMRYVGNNTVQVSSLRYMQYQGKGDMSALPRIEPKFVAHAQRELAPAAKRIEESVRFELTDGKLAPLADGVLFTGLKGTSPFISENVFGEETIYDIPVWPIANIGDLGWSNVQSRTLFIDPSQYTLSGDMADDAKRMIFIAGNTGNSRAVSFGQRMACRDFRIELQFGRVAERMNNRLSYAWFVWPARFRGYLSVLQNGITQYYNGSGWQAAEYLIDEEIVEGMFAMDVPLSKFVGSAIVKLTIQEIVIGWKIGDVSDGQGLYVAVSSLKSAPIKSSLLETNRVNTNYDETNNVIIKRDPLLAPAYNEVPFPQVIKNGIFLIQDGAYVPAKEWAWPGGTPHQMAVYNHLQLLCYYAKPNNVITGDIINADLGDIRALYVWEGKEHLLQGGSLNFLNGRIEGAILREFTRYESLWGAMTRSVAMPEVEESSTTNLESGSSPASDSYDINTEVYLGGGGGTIVIDKAMSDTSQNAVENRVIKAYIDAGDNLIKEEIEWLKQQAGADTPSSFYHDMAAIVSHTGMITRQTREQLYNIFTYTEGDDISSEPAWVIDTNGQHYIVRMLQTETGVGFFIIGYEGYTRIEGDNTKTNQLLRDKIDKEYVKDFLSQASFDPAKTHDYIIPKVESYTSVEDSVGAGGRSVNFSIDLRIKDDIASAAEDDPDNGLFRNGLVTALGVKNWVENKGYLTSAAMGSYATKADIANFVTKGTTLAHYGITDAVKDESYSITPNSSSPSVGYALTSNGWAHQGAVMKLGYMGAYQLRLIAKSGNNYIPDIYISGRYLNNESEWAKVLTDNNIGSLAIAMDNDGRNLLATDTSAKCGYVYGENGWKTTGPALITNRGGYSGLFNFAMSNMGSTPDNITLYINLNSGGTLGNWAKVVTDKNFTEFGVKAGVKETTGSANDIVEPSIVGYTENLSNTPFNYGNLLTMTTKTKYYVGQIVINYAGRMSVRGRSESAWTEWAEVLTNKNIGDYADSRYLKLTGGTLSGQLYIESTSGDRYIHSKCNTAHIAFGVGSGGYNRGIFDITNGAWWIYRNSANLAFFAGDSRFEGDVTLAYGKGLTLSDVKITKWSDIAPYIGGGFVKNNTQLLPNNVFDNLGKIQISQLDNALYAAAHRFNITLDGFASESKGVLFNGSYEDSIQVPMGQTATIKIDNNGNDIIAGYPYGNIILSFYYQSVPESVSIRVYTTYGTAGWYSLPLSEIRGTNGGVFVFSNGNYAVKEVEITITAKANINAALSEIDWFLNSASLSNLPVVTKFGIDQELYGRLICKGGLTLDNKTVFSWSDFITSDGGTIKAGKSLTFGDGASIVLKQIQSWEPAKLLVSGGVSIGNMYMLERIYIEEYEGLGARIAFRDKNGTIIDSITTFDDLRIKVVEQTATSGVSIAPNVLNKWTTPLTGTLTINFSAGRTGVANYYMMEFKTGATVPTITLPSGITWQGGGNILSRLEPNKTYQISVLNNLAVGGAF